MSSKQRRIIAKEIVDQTLSHFKKQREDSVARAKEPRSQEVVRKPKPKYEPSANFVKTFSEIMGEKTNPSNDVKLSENPRLKSLSLKDAQQSRESEMKDTARGPNEKPYLPQAPAQTAVPEHKEEVASRPAQPSIFQRLSRQEPAENSAHDPEQEAKQSPGKEDAKKETVSPNARVSVFERLSRSANSS